jgi:hypothetical protein
MKELNRQLYKWKKKQIILSYVQALFPYIRLRFVFFHLDVARYYYDNKQTCIFI